jgi:hypothetical protein
MPARSKYNARRTEVDGITFHSRREAKRYAELKLMERAGEIRDLILQPEYPVVVGADKHVCTYIADFAYKHGARLMVEDCKGFRTPTYRLKKKLVEALYGIEITET